MSVFYQKHHQVCPKNKIEQNILYRDKTSSGWDEYMAERCRLDIYYPKVNCPAYMEDATAAVAWVFRNIPKFGIVGQI
jgi:hypothetical protein